MAFVDSYFQAFLKSFLQQVEQSGLQAPHGVSNLTDFNSFYQHLAGIPCYPLSYSNCPTDQYLQPQSWSMNQTPLRSNSSPVPQLVQDSHQASSSSPPVLTPPHQPAKQPTAEDRARAHKMIDTLHPHRQAAQRNVSPLPNDNTPQKEEPRLKRKRSQEGLTPLRAQQSGEPNLVSDDTRNAAHELLGLGMQFDGQAESNNRRSGMVDESSSPAVNGSSRGAMERLLGGGAGSSTDLDKQMAVPQSTQAEANPQVPAPDFRRFFAAAAAGHQTENFSPMPQQFQPLPQSFAPMTQSYFQAPMNNSMYEAIDPELARAISPAPSAMSHHEEEYRYAQPGLGASQVSLDPSMRSSQSSEQGSYTTLATSVSSRAPTPSLNGSVNDAPAPKKKGGKKADGAKTTKRDRSGKPPFSYAALIGQAIFNAPDKRISLNDIYTYIIDNYTYYKKEDAGWQNSIRHNLSLNECFMKTPRDASQPGKGALWTVVTGCEEQFANGGFVKKGGTRKAKAGPKAKANAKVPSTASTSQLAPPESASAAPSPAPSETGSIQSDTSYASTAPPKKRQKRDASLLSQPPSASSSHTTFVEPELPAKEPDEVYEEETDDIDIPLQPPAPVRRSHRRRHSTMRDTQNAVQEFQLPNRNDAAEPIKRHVLGSPKLGRAGAAAIFSREDDLPSHQELAAALLASPVPAVSAGMPIRETTPPPSTFGGFLPPVQIRQGAAPFRSPEVSAAEFGGPAYNMFSAVTQSPVSSLRGNFNPIASPRQTSNIRGDDEDQEEALRGDDDGMPAPRGTSAPAAADIKATDETMQTPVVPSSNNRAESAPNPQAREASRALQFMQGTPGPPGCRPYATSPGKPPGSPMGHYAWNTSFSDPYDTIGSELERMSESKSHPFSNWPQTPGTFSTPRLPSALGSWSSPAW